MRTARYTVPALATAVALLIGVLVGPADAHARGQQHQGTDVLASADLADVGDAHLLRTNRGVTTLARASGIEPGAYSMWWVVWNAPESCETPFACGEADLGNPDTQVAIGHGGGGITVGRNGHLVVGASLREGRPLTGLPTEFGLPLAEGLADAGHAEVHLILRHHGPVIPRLLGDQIRTFNGGCVYDGPIAGTEPAYGRPGPNTCEDLYFAVFPSPNAS